MPTLPLRDSLCNRAHGCDELSGAVQFWLKTEIELAKNYNLSRKRLREIEAIIEEDHDEFLTAWREHFQS